ncbi:MAG: hypothetical protein NZ842_00280, partial [Dehalococcoidia bacterium]|nr:hypothetical protein [Dehalococcoidia bacterium]
EKAGGVSVEVWSELGFGSWAPLAEDGTFTINVAKGIYEVFFWIDPYYFPNYGSPGAAEVRLKPNTTLDLTANKSPFASSLIDDTFANGKALTFSTLDSRITGKVTASDGTTGLPQVEVFAWSRNGGWADTQTDRDGNYEMYVIKGKWEVVAEPGWNSSYAPQPPKRTKVAKGQDAVVDFSFSSAGNTVTGAIRDTTGKLVSSLWGWAYARSYDPTSGTDDTFDVISDGPVDSGEFTLKLPDGYYKIGLWIGPESGYTMAADPNGSTSEVEPSVSLSGSETSSSVTIYVGTNDKTITGAFLDADGETITGVEGDVFAVQGGTRGGSWIGTTINEEDGTYELNLTSGVWDLSYYLELNDDDEDYPVSPNRPFAVDLTSETTATQNITLVALAGSISGNILLPDGTAISDEVYVFVNRVTDSGADPYFDDVQTSDGAFSLKLESGHFYDVGVYLELDSSYAEPEVVQVDLTGSNELTGLTLQLGNNDSTISGSITLSPAVSLDEEVYVYAWSTKGQAVESTSDETGAYSLSVPSGAVWYLGSDYQTEDGTTYSTNNELAVDLTAGSQNVTGKDLVIYQQSYSLPGSVADSFTVSSGYSKVLADGTQIDIPANAVPVTDTSSTVTINISPLTTGLSSTSTTKPVGYGYSFELLDSSGKSITSNFTKDVIITISYDETQVSNEDNIKVSFYSS